MTIYIFALHGVATGGPEATHQLSAALIEQGFDARLLYFQWPDLAKGPLAEMPAYTSFAEEYARYKVNLARQAPDEDGAVIVLPETLAHLVPFYIKAKVLVWWLSVDNAFGALSGVNLNYLRRPNVYHASQSQYAAKFCEALQLNHIGMLSDYTVDLTEYADPLPIHERPKIVAFNARPDKVIADIPAIAAEIHALDPDIRFVLIHGMSRPEIAAVFAAARVYVDIGNFPGKDRLPREAASMGCRPILGARGAAREDMAHWCVSFESFFCERIVETARNPAIGLLNVDRHDITYERSVFIAEVHNVFSRL